MNVGDRVTCPGFIAMAGTVNFVDPRGWCTVLWDTGVTTFERPADRTIVLIQNPTNQTR